MCDIDVAVPSGAASEPGVTHGGGLVSRRRVLGAAATSAAAVTAANLLGRIPSAQAAPASVAGSSPGLSVALLGTAGGPPPVAARSGIASVLVLNGRSYVIDCGRGAVSQFLRAGLSLPSLAGIFLTHLHSDHTVDYFSFPLLSAQTQPGFQPVAVYGPGQAGEPSLLADAPGTIPGTAGLTRLANQAFAASSSFFIAEHIGIDPATLVNVQEVMPPASAGASLSDPAPAMAPFTVLENSDVKVTAILVPHGAVYPAYAYRFDTDYGSVVFSGDTAPTPNIPVLAGDADLLVHEVVDLAAFAGLGLPPALITHLASVHTDVTKLGGIAAQSGVRALVATHLSPPDPAILSNEGWRQALRASAQKADFTGPMILGMDLMRIPIRP